MPLPNPLQAIVTARTSPIVNQESIQLALFDSTGAPLNVGKQVATQAATTAVDLAALKVDFNALLTKLKAAGVMAP